MNFIFNKNLKKLKKITKFQKMTRDMYGDGVNVNLMTETKLNIFKELEDQIEQKIIKGSK